LQEQLRALYDLQVLDDKISELSKEADQIPVHIQSLNDKIGEHQTVLDEKENGLKALFQSRKDKESSLVDFETKIGNGKTKLMAVKTNKEYHAIQKEIEGHEESISALEEDILLLMDDIEQFDIETKRAASRFKIQKKEIEQQVKEYEGRLAEIPKNLSAEQDKRGELGGNVRSDLLGRYEMTRKQRDGHAVAFIEDGICMGCNIAIRPQLYNQIQRNEDVYTCPNCHRICYFPGTATVNDI
jgi:hypothetical protein